MNSITSLPSPSRIAASPRSLHCGILLILLGAVSALTSADNGPLGSADGVPRTKLQVAAPEVSQKLSAQGGQLIADYGSYQLWTAPTDLATALADQDGVTVCEDDNVIELYAGPIDTSVAPAQQAAGPAEEFVGRRLHLIQFAGPMKPEWRDALVGQGWHIVTYVPRNAYLVYGDSAALVQFRNAARGLAHIQWEGRYLPEHKTHPRAQAAGQMALRGEVTDDLFAIQLVEDEAANAQSLQFLDQIRRRLVRRSAFLGYVNVVLRLPPERLGEVAAFPDVVSIQTYEVPRKRDERQGQILAGNLTAGVPSGPGYLAWVASKGFTAAQFAASGFAVDVSDSGIDNGTQVPGHPGLHTLGNPTLAGRVAYNRLVGTPNVGSTLQACDGHGNLNSHIIAGYNDLSGFPHTDSAGYHYGLGICPFVRVGSSVIFDPDYFTDPNYAELQSRAYQDGTRISCNSWGADVGGAYNIDSQAYDALVRDAQPSGSPFPTPGNQQMVIVFSAGNSGSSANTIGAPGTGKNIISVGAAENVHSHSTANGGNNSTGNDGCGITDTGANNANDIISFSSRGPCDDSRVKPDIMGPGTHVTGGVGQQSPPGALGTALACFMASGVCALPGGGTVGNANNFFPLNQQFYTTSSGTSHSCPAVGGGAALLRQYFLNRIWPAPSPAMTKAWLMNSSRYMTGLYANDTLPSNNQGMGMMNLGTAFDGVPRVRRDQLEEDRFTASGQTRVFEGYVADPGQPFRVTSAWTDAPGSTTGNAYKNNLDLTVTIGGQTYRGNVFSGSRSVTGGVADVRNNVESVFLPAGVSGQFTITVTAANINSDGVPGNADALDQDFALVIYNSSDRPVDLVPAGTTVTAESCSPAQGTIDPGETVTVEFALRNIGPSNSVALVGTLLATNGVLAPSGPQSYGVVGGGGAVVSRPFTFTAAGTCGGTLGALMRLQDGADDYGVVAFPLSFGQLGTNALPQTNATTLTISATSGAVAPYPSTITVSGAPGAVSKVAVTLRGLSHTWPDDLDVLLVGPQGQAVMLLSDVGGDNDVTNLTVTLDDAAAASLPDDAPLTDGSWRPTNFETDAAFPAPAPAAPSAAALSAFVGTDPNGAWKLFVADDYPSDDGGEILGGWELTLVTTNLVCCVDPSSADLGVHGTDSPDPVAPFNTVAYTIMVTNQGPALATSVSLMSTLSSGASFLWGNASQGTLTHASGIVTCNLGSLAPGGVAMVTISVLAVAGPELVCSSVVAAAQPDPNPLNNQAETITSVIVPALTIQDTSVIEGDGNGTMAVFLLALSQPASQSVTVDYHTTDGTATAGADYVPLTHRAIFLPGEISKTIEVLVLGDTLDEEDETFRVVLTNVVNAALADGEAVATILDDDPMPSLSVADCAVVEGNSGSTNAVFTVSLSGPSGRSVSALVSTTNGTATAGSDYAAVVAQTVRLLPGQTATNVAVTVHGDTQIERDETFFGRLSSPTNAVLSRSTGVGTILTDDLSPLVSVVAYRVIAESQLPPNGVVDAGETVTLSVALRNDGSTDTTNLVATLLPGNGVAGPSGPQTYGVLTAGGPQVSRPFTFTAAVPNCGTVRAAFQLQDGAANFGTQTLSIVVGDCFVDDFEPDIDLSQWAAFGGTPGSTVLATNYGGFVSPTHSLWFGDDGSRFATTRPIDTSCGGIVSFYLRLASGSLSGQWEMVDLPDEGVVMEYSINAGSTWVVMGRYTNASFYAWTQVTESVPLAARTAATQFRWRQLTHSGSCCDHWALDDVLINTPTTPSIVSHPASQAARPGTNVTFCVSAIGCSPLSYQWRKDGTNLLDGGRISGTTNPCLTITGAVEDDSGLYSVAITNAYGFAISSNATLLVSALDHFAWSAVASPQTAYVPFEATITAQDYLNNPVTNFAGSVALGQWWSALNESFDGVTAPALPVGWTASLTGAGSRWATTTARRDTLPNSAFAPDPSTTCDNRLTSPVFFVPAGGAQLSFRHAYSTESCCDYGLLEISIAGGAFTEIIAAGGSFVTGGYDDYGWRGTSAGFPSFITSVANLPSSASGRNIQLRWRFTADGSVSGTGWYVDTVVMTGSSLAVAINPTNTDNFTNGVWSGPVTVFAPATNLVLRAADMFGHFGLSTQFEVLPDVLAVTPAEGLESSGYEGGPFSPSDKVYALTNNGGASLDWSATCPQPWITVVPADGSLAPGAGTNATVLINTNACGLTNGTYAATVTFHNLTSGAAETRAVQLTAYVCVPPTVPTNPLPTNGATLVSVHTLLSWNSSGGMGNTMDTDGTIQDVTLTGRPSSLTVGSGALEPGLSPLSAGGDNFDRTDGTDMGPNWVERAGNWRIESQRARSSASTSFDLMTFSGTSSEPVLAVDAFCTGSPRLTYAALVSKYADLNNCLHIKVQDSSSAGNFNYAGFYYGNGGGGWPGMTGGAAYFSITPFTSGRITTRFSGDSITLEIDSNFDGVPEQTYTRGGIPLGSLGDGVGLGGYNNGEFDNFSVDGGTPAATYDVYFGTNAGALSLIASNLTETTCDPGLLTFNTPYYWQVVAQACGRATGAVWTFTTALDEVRFAAATNSIGEGGGAALITVVRENTNAGLITVQYATTNGTATAASDYMATNGTLELVAGQVSTNFEVRVLEDSLFEGNETVLLRLSPASPNVLLGTNATLTIVDNDAVRVSLFFNSAYVDTSTGTGGEATNVIVALRAKGCVVETFTGITPTAFSNALVGADILYIPELEIGDLALALSASAKSVISDFVASGGGLIINGESGSRDESFVNQVFGHSIASASWGGTTALTGAAAGTAFAGGPSPIPENNDTYEWLRSSLPAGSLSIYQDSGALYTTVAVIPRGVGKIVFLAYDWFDAVPRGTQDGGWDEVLRRAVLEAVTPLDDLVVAPAAGLVASGYPGGPFNPSDTVYTLTNSGSASLNWSATCFQPWVTLDPSNGSLAAGASTNARVLINTNACSLSNGTYYATVTFSNLTSGVTQTRAVQLTVLVCVAPTMPSNPLPTNGATVVSVHAPLSWNNVGTGHAILGLNGTYGVIDTSGYDAEALTHIQGLPGLTATPVSWAVIASSSGAALFAAYDVIYFSVNANSTDYLNLRTAVTTGSSLEQFVSLGGTLVLNLAGNNGSQAAIGPGGLNYDRSLTHEAETIAAPTHPYATGAGYGGTALTSAMFNSWGSTDHGTLTGVPVGATELLRNTDGTSMIEYSWGAGRVIASTLTFGWGGYAQFSGPPFDNELLYAASGLGMDASRYDVYFGTNVAALSLIASNLTVTTCDPGLLAFNTPYYWQVVAQACGRATGAVWTFTTALDEIRFASVTNSISESGRVALITVIRENTNAGPVAVQYATTNGSATAGLDYVATNGTFEFVAGLASTNFEVRVLEDSVPEVNETVLLGLSQPSTNVLLGSDATLTIVDNDGPPDFQITGLLTSNSRVVDHDALTGDDRGGIAVSTSQVFVTGDNATARFNAADLTGGVSLGRTVDGLCVDLRTETVYALGNGTNALTWTGGTVTSLIELNGATGQPTGAIVPLSLSFTMPAYVYAATNGIFSGYGRVVVLNGTRAYDIYVPSGTVTDRGAMTWTNWMPSESWSVWGVAEYFGGTLYVACARNPYPVTTIERVRVPDGAVSTIGTFSNLSDMASWTVSVSRSRWYFHYESSGQFGGTSETLGYADATFLTGPTNDLAVRPFDGLASIGYRGGPFDPSNKVYTVSNLGGSNLAWGASGMAGWIAVSPPNGVLEPGTTTNVTVELAALAASLPPGTNTDTVVFTNVTSGGSQTRALRLVVLPRVLDHFAWSAIPSPQWVGATFAVTITAQDSFGIPVTEFTGPVRLSGWTGGSLIEDFESGTWPHAPWVPRASPGTLSPTHAHDGAYGLGDPEWTFQTNVLIGNPGDLLSAWIRPASSASGRAYLGFAASASGCWSAVAAPNSSQFIIQQNAGYGTSDRVVAAQSWQSNKWYKVVIQFLSTTSVSCQLYDSDGTTLLNSLSYGSVTGLPGGVAMRSFGRFSLDTIGRGIDPAQITLTRTNTDNFTNGVWTGDVAVLGVATNMLLRADDGSGHQGDSNPFNVAAPPTITCTYNAGSGTLEIAWNGTGFQLQAQTNSLGVGITTNWFDYPGGTSSPVTIPIDPANPSVFYRLKRLQSALADFAAAPTSGSAPLTVCFTNLSSEATSYRWDFGDGNASTNPHPVHTYTDAGVYTVSLTASGTGGSNRLARASYIVARPTVTCRYNAGSGTLEITWNGRNFHLEAQTNSLSVGITNNWFKYPGGTNSPVVIPIDPAHPSAFYRLVSP